MGREGVVQRALSTLVYGHTDFRWNVPGPPSERGRDFLGWLLEPVGEELPDDAPFVEEFELRDGDVNGPAGWPDFAILGDELLVLIELKTEVRSHQLGQRRRYLELAEHRYPTLRRRLLYVTPPMEPLPTPEDVPAGSEHRHVTWEPVREAIVSVWGGSSVACEREIAEQLDQWLRHIETGAGPPPRQEVTVEEELIVHVLRDAAEVERTHEQSALDLWLGHPELLDLLRERVADRIRQGIEVEGESIRHVRPWVWSEVSSGGQALSTVGRTFGYQLRLSYYSEELT